MSKRNAFLIHLGMSVVVFGILLMLIIYVWYPSPYFDMAYRMKWIKLIAFIDLVIGPGLTLLVFKPNKPSIRFDMSVILILQLSALSWGVWNAWSVHPRLNVYFDSQIYCLDHNELKLSGFDPSMAASPMPDKIMTILPYPETAEKKRAYLAMAQGTRSMIYYLGKEYQFVDTEITSRLDQEQSGFLSVAEATESNKEQWTSFISAHGGDHADWRFYRFNCLEDNRTIVFNRKSNKIEAVLKIGLPPFWEYK